MIKNATAQNDIDSIIFVVVDLINRLEKCEVTGQEERVLYAQMNEKAGKKALSLPDFNSAARYTESAVLFLDESYWSTHHDLMLSIYETSAAALYSCGSNGNQDVLRDRVAKVLQHASNLDEEFRTRCLWIKVLSATSVSKAIDECHLVLKRLDKPINETDVDPKSAGAELVRVKAAFLGEKCDIASLAQMVDPNKLKAMKLMSMLSVFYKLEWSFMNAIVVSRMVELSMSFGACEESSFAFASFSALLVSNLHDIDGGCCWARMALTLMSKSHHGANIMIPSLVSRCILVLFREPMLPSNNSVLSMPLCMAFRLFGRNRYR